MKTGKTRRKEKQINRIGPTSFIGFCVTCGVNLDSHDKSKARSHAYRTGHKVRGEETVAYVFDYTDRVVS